ncbi:AAA family ATPase [Mesorhizobium sp. AR10]|uniref:ATP-binding sensor histidine kinase n=1 Tax=Mesorhizobium sp. AR10 TaxID=2865839 RepID=UPI00215E9456|nr:AAA family ATPase [Mesorhizobium sp. AR10]UVK38859.1 AAA family ATPase [Mesorhizobium sp. AR10]
MTELSGYVFSALRRGEFTLYRGSGDGLDPILLVAPIGEHSARESVKRLEHEHELKAELNPDWAVRPVDLSRHEGRTALVLEDPGGEPLDQTLGQPMDVTQFLRIAIPLAAAVGQVHVRGLIHKDIKPANILVDSASGGVWLTGFGIASRLPRERQAPAPPEVIAGTLAYMAPEQTGRMNRSIDARSDLYALGVTLYEMLTGALPFTASDPMEWVHCHIARQPTPPDERVSGIPGPVSAMVMKLLAKTAEDRYQTAAGLSVDLRTCLAQWQSQHRLEPFPLGVSDVSDRLVTPETLYGREHEIGTLLRAFDRVVANGTTELVLVSGYAGIGKSSLVNELQKALVPPRGRFASGKFDQYKRDIPYATLAQGFRSLVRPLLGESETELGRWRDSLSEALGPNGQLIVNLVPELELVIGKQPPVADLPPQDAQNRFQMVFRRFLAVFARAEHPLALFLDDLQWLDAATLDLLEHLVTHTEVGHLLLVGAYRDNEVDPAHPLMRTLGAIRETGARIEEIVLTPLELHDIGRLIMDAVHCEPERARPLAQLVYEKTSGNPFFAIQFLTALNEDGLLVFDPAAPAWRWDIDRIHARSYTDNVADLLVEKMKRLSIPTQEGMKQFACLGNASDVATLALVYEETEAGVHAALWDAVCAGLVMRQETGYTFLHDRIQQAAYSLIPQEHRADVHLRIGRALLTSMAADQLAEHLFDVASQLSRGAARLIDRNERAQVAAIDLRAGRKAKASAAYASARAYFAAGMALLGESDWGSQYELTFSLWLERAECEFLTGDFDRGAQLIGELLQRATLKVDRAAVYVLNVSLFTARSETAQAVDSALIGLRLLDIDLPAHPTWEQVQAEYESVWQTLDGRPIESLIDLPPMTNPELQAGMRVLSALTPAAYFTDLHLYCLIACRMAKLGIQHGISDASPLGYALLGQILGPLFHRYPDAHRFANLACALVDKHGFIASRAKVYETAGIAALWTQPIGTAIDFMRVTFRAAIETGDLTYACFSMVESITDFLLRNDPLDAVWRETEESLHFVRKARYQDVAAVIVSQQRFIATMQGRTASFSTFSDAQFDETAFEAELGGNSPTTVCFYWILKLKARFLSGDYAEALASADKAKALLWASAIHIQRLDYFYYAALTVAACYENGSANQQQEWREVLTAHQEQLREWAENYPPTFAEKHALVSAEIARLEGRDADAMRLYEHAIQSARENGFVQNEGLAHELAAQFYAARGFERFAHVCLRDARHCYLRWGALGKVKQLEERYPHLREERTPTSHAATIGAPVAQLDVETAVKASQAVSGEIELNKLIETLMTITLEHAGAERGLLITFRDDEPQIVAEATAGQGRIEVSVREVVLNPLALPQSALHYVIRTREIVVLDDASVRNLYSDDEYVRQKHPRSVLCLPIVKQTKLVGALYLENNLTPYAFTSSRVAVLELLASQAAISLENARLYSERKRAEEELRRSEAYLAEAQRLSRTGSFGWNIATGEVIWSDETFRIFGYDRAPSFTTDMVVQRTHPDDRAAVQQTIDRAARDVKDFSHEYRLLMPDGAVKHVHAVAHAVKDASDNIEFFGAVTDVTATKQAEEALRESEQRFRDYAEIASDWLWETGPDHRFIHLSEQFAIFGTSPARRIRLTRWDFATDLDEEPEKWRRHIATLEAHRPFRGFVFRVAADDGSARFIATSGKPVFDADGEFRGYRGTGTDVTALVRAEQALRESERSARSALDGIAGLVAIMTPNGEVETVNRQCLEYFGRSLVEQRDWQATDMVHPEDLPQMLENLKRAMASEIPYHFEQRLRRFDGEYRWFETRGGAVRDDTGRIMRWYVLLTDIEDRIRALARLDQMQSDFAHMNRVSLMGELAASLSHEITQPIAAARNNARAAMHFLDRKSPDLAEIGEALACIVDDADRAGDIVDRIRDQIKKAPPRKSRFDLNEAINEVIGLTRSAFAKNRVSVQTRLMEGLAPVEGDRVKLQQVVLNLILNAIEAMSTVEEGPRELSISTEQTGTGGVLVSVRDTGPGIDPEHGERVFDAFYTTKSSGVGMGLSISRSIIDAHGGRLWADANELRGAVFQFSLPRDGKELTTFRRSAAGLNSCAKTPYQKPLIKRLTKVTNDPIV